VQVFEENEGTQDAPEIANKNFKSAS